MYAHTCMHACTCTISRSCKQRCLENQISEVDFSSHLPRRKWGLIDHACSFSLNQWVLAHSFLGGLTIFNVCTLNLPNKKQRCPLKSSGTLSLSPFCFKKKLKKRKEDVLLLFPELGSTFRGTQTKTTDILSYTISKIRLSSADNSVCQTAQEKNDRQWGYSSSLGLPISYCLLSPPLPPHLMSCSTVPWNLISILLIALQCPLFTRPLAPGDRYNQLYFQGSHRGWKDHSVVRSTFCSHRGLSSRTLDSSQLPKGYDTSGLCTFMSAYLQTDALPYLPFKIIKINFWREVKMICLSVFSKGMWLE